MSENPVHKVLHGLLTADYSEKAFAVSMEAETDGKKRDEIEFQIYGRLVDPSELESASSCETQEQWGVKIRKTDQNAAQGTMRVRSINRGEKYIYTTKIKTPVGTDKEAERPSSFDEFSMFAVMGEHGMIKKRFTFPVDGFVYEVDVPLDENGELHPYVKIDLEVPAPPIDNPTPAQMSEYIKSIKLPPLPITLTEVLVLPPIDRPKEVEKAISLLYPKYFLTPNIFLDPTKKSASEINPLTFFDRSDE